jgi:sigma-B regulation protein RsbU (phosphoserine phosphatase)
MNEKKYDLEYLERQLHNLTKLVEINRIINSTLDMARLFTIIMEIIKEIMETEASTLFLYDEKTNELVFKVALGEAGDKLQEKYRVKLGQGIAGWVAKERKGVFVNDVYSDNRFDPNFDKQTGFTTRSIICVPLLYKGKLLGVIQAINPINRPAFTEEDMNLFMAFADQAVLAVQNAIFFEHAIEEARMRHELESAKAIQHSLHPAISEDFGFCTVAARYMPAREVGGEFYEIKQYDNALAVALCDVHNKGVPGALNAALVNGLMKGLMNVYGNVVSPVFINTLKVVQAHNIKTVSLFFGIIHAQLKTLTFMNTGEAYPVLIRNGIARYLRFSHSIEKNKKVVIKLLPDDMFVIVTDGIVNCKNRNARLFGLKQVMDTCCQYNEPSECIDGLLAKVKEFMQGLSQREDISVIAVKIQ